jgi:hypothetical protein
MPVIASALACSAALGQTAKPLASEVAGIPVNYEETRVGTYTLPDPLVLANGKPCAGRENMESKAAN